MSKLETTVPVVNADLPVYKYDHREDDTAPIFDREFVVSLGWDIKNVFKPFPVMWSDFAALLSAAPVAKSKMASRALVLCSLDGPLKRYEDRYNPGLWHEGYHRVGHNAVAVHAVAIDFDHADTTFAAVLARVKALGLEAVVHTSHSHLKEVTKPEGDSAGALEKAFAKVPPCLRPRIEGKVVKHDPWPKLHLLFPLYAPWRVPREKVTLSDKQKEDTRSGDIHLTDDAKDIYNAAYRLFAHEFSAPLNAIFDEACGDITHPFYLPARRSEDAVYEYSHMKGKALDWQSYVDRAVAGERAPDPASTAHRHNGKARKGETPRKGASRKPETVAHHSTLKTTPAPDLPAGWNGRMLRDFELASALAEAEGVKVRGDKLSAGKLEIECPYAEDHSDAGNPNDSACCVWNASEGREDDFGHQKPAISCRHDHCNGRSTWDFVAKLLADGKIALGLFDDARFKIKRKTVQEIVAERKAAQAARDRRKKAEGAMT